MNCRQEHVARRACGPGLGRASCESERQAVRFLGAVREKQRGQVGRANQCRRRFPRRRGPARRRSERIEPSPIARQRLLVGIDEHLELCRSQQIRCGRHAESSPLRSRQDRLAEDEPGLLQALFNAAQRPLAGARTRRSLRCRGAVRFGGRGRIPTHCTGDERRRIIRRRRFLGLTAAEEETTCRCDCYHGDPHAKPTWRVSCPQRMGCKTGKGVSPSPSRFCGSCVEPTSFRT